MEGNPGTTTLAFFTSTTTVDSCSSEPRSPFDPSSAAWSMSADWACIAPLMLELRYSLHERSIPNGKKKKSPKSSDETGFRRVVHSGSISGLSGAGLDGPDGRNRTGPDGTGRTDGAGPDGAGRTDGPDRTEPDRTGRAPSAGLSRMCVPIPASLFTFFDIRF